MKERSRGDHLGRGHHGDAGDPTISNTVTTSVTLGVAPYFNPLTITATGAIVPTTKGAYPALSVASSVSGAIVINQGRIAGPAGLIGASSFPGGDGVDFAASGTLTNSGTIIGGTGGTNTRFFSGGHGGAGVSLTSTGTIINTGTIIGGTGGPGGALPTGGFGGAGVFIDSGMLINAGTIIEGAAGGLAGTRVGPAVQFGSGAATLVVEPGAVFTGQIVANAAATDVLVLGGTTAGTLTGLGTSFANFSSVAVSQNANWTLTGANTVATVVNNGTAAIASGGSLDVSSAVDPTSSGVFQLTGNAALEVATALGTKEKIQFLRGTTGNELIVDKASSFGTNVGSTSYSGALLENFTAGEVIDLKGIASTGLQLAYSTASGDLQITGGGSALATLMFQNSTLGSGTFHTASDDSGGTLVTHS